uniref:Conotoxin Mr6.11 n=1 Tax=Conus marmoreus TaxID=42752 RepID=M9PM85_CONMR|nr:conotoxin Mr6.11 [Conus marmoreus]
MSKLGVVLFLTACQLLTADNSRDKQEYPTMRFRDQMRNAKGPKWIRSCAQSGLSCDTRPCCDDKPCVPNGRQSMCGG